MPDDRLVGMPPTPARLPVYCVALLNQLLGYWCSPGHGGGGHKPHPQGLRTGHLLGCVRGRAVRGAAARAGRAGAGPDHASSVPG